MRYCDLKIWPVLLPYTYVFVCVCVCIIGSGLYLKLHVYNYREIYISSTPFGEYTNSIVHKTFQKNIVIVVVKYLSNIMH